MLEEVDIKLAEWAGWEDIEIVEISGAHDSRRRIQGHKDSSWTWSWLFTESLSACYLELVPKLLEKYNIECCSYKQAKDWYYSEVNIWTKGSTKHGSEILHDTHIAKSFQQDKVLSLATSRAFCLAVEEVIDKEEVSG